MSAPVSVSAFAARALARPAMLPIARALSDAPRSRSGLARDLGLTRSAVSHALNDLIECGLIRQRGQLYEPVAQPVISDAVWEALGAAHKQAILAQALGQAHADATAAADNGGFDAANTQLAHLRLRVDQRGWNELCERLRANHDDAVTIDVQSRRRGRRRKPRSSRQPQLRNVSVVHMGFRRADPAHDALDDQPTVCAELYDAEAYRTLLALMDEANEMIGDQHADPHYLASLFERLAFVSRAWATLLRQPTTARPEDRVERHA